MIQIIEDYPRTKEHLIDLLGTSLVRKASPLAWLRQLEEHEIEQVLSAEQYKRYRDLVTYQDRLLTYFNEAFCRSIDSLTHLSSLVFEEDAQRLDHYRNRLFGHFLYCSDHRYTDEMDYLSCVFSNTGRIRTRLDSLSIHFDMCQCDLQKLEIPMCFHAVLPGLRSLELGIDCDCPCRGGNYCPECFSVFRILTVCSNLETLSLTLLFRDSTERTAISDDVDQLFRSGPAGKTLTLHKLQELKLLGNMMTWPDTLIDILWRHAGSLRRIVLMRITHLWSGADVSDQWVQLLDIMRDLKLEEVKLGGICGFERAVHDDCDHQLGVWSNTHCAAGASLNKSLLEYVMHKRDDNPLIGLAEQEELYDTYTLRLNMACGTYGMGKSCTQAVAFNIAVRGR